MHTPSELLADRVKHVFQTTYGDAATHLIQAPGRVNLIGEHTDYNDGFVLPCAINYQTMVAASARADTIVRVISVDYGNQCDQFDLADEIVFVEDKMWANYIRGVVKCLCDAGYRLRGADLVVSGNVPQGAGLSSSAALEVAIGQTFKALFKLSITQQQIALNGQQAENEFVGCQCGIMDQLIAACGEKDHALLIDCRSLVCQPIPMPEELVVMIINSNKKRGLVDSEYNTRRQQCETAAHAFSVAALRDLSLTQLQQGADRLAPVVFKRARHVISENQRTIAAAEALQANDIKTMASLMAASHASMRDDFQITVGEIDLLVNIVKQQLGDEGGVRMTGGGFGGCVVAIMSPDLVEGVKAAVLTEYEKATGLQASIYVCQAEQGAGIIHV